MFSKIAAAKAFLDAGNAARAKTEIESVLRDDPHNGMALDVYALVLRERDEWDMVETISKDRLARDPKCTSAYANLLLRYHKANRRRDAKLLREQYAANVLDPSDIQTLNEVYEVCFGDKAAALTSLSDKAAAAGDHRSAFNFASRAKFSRGDLKAALLEAEFARRTGDNSASNLERLSVLSFRLMRLTECRRYARAALKADPLGMFPRELIILSWLSYLPPFLLAGWLLRLMISVSRVHTAWIMIGSYLLAPVIVVALYSVVLAISGLLRVSPLAVGALSCLFFIYIWLMLGSVANLFSRHANKEVKLEDY